MKKLLVILTSVMFLGGQVFPALAVVGGVGGNDIKPNSVQAPLRAPAMDPALGEILQKKAPSVFQDPLEGPTSGVLASHATGASLLHDWGYKGKGSKIAIIAEEFNPEGILNLAKKGAIAQAALTFDDFLPVDIQKNLSLADINVDHIYDVQLKTLVGGSAHLAPGGQKNWHQEMDNLARLARLKKRYDASKEEGYFSFGQAYLELTHQMAPDATLLPLNFWNAPQVGDDPKGVGRILNTLQMAIDEGVDTIHLELANASLWSKEDWGLLTGMLKATRDKGIMTFMAAKDETTFEKIHHFDKPGQENIPFDQILKDLGQKGLAIVGGTTYLDASEAPEVSGYSSLPSRGETPFLLAPGEKVYGNFSSTYLASSVAAGAYGLLKGYARQHKIPLTNPQDLLNVLMESGTGTAPNRFWTHKEAGPEVKTIDVASALRLLHQKTFSPRPNVAPVPAPGKSSALAQAQKKPQVKPAKAQDQGVFLNPEDPQNSKVSIPGSTKVDIFHKGGFKGKGMKIAVIENEFRPDALIKFAKKGLIDDKILAMQGLLKEDLAANIDFKKLNLTQLQKDIDRASLALAGAHLPQDQKLWWEERSRLMRWYAFKQEYDEDKAIGGSHGYGALDAAHQMAPEATLVPIKINQFSKSDDADEVRIQQLRAIQTAIDEGVDAINFSIRWMDNSIEYIKGIADLFKVARDKGIAIFISAGNDSSDEAIQRTDAYADINTIANKLDFKGFYTIGATQYRPDASPAIGQVAGWWGTALPSKGKFEDIFLMAPGVSLSLKNSKVGHGTSFASPATAGAYVLLKQYAQKNKLSFKGPDELFQTLKTAGTAVTQHSWGDEKLPPFQTINMENALKAMEERLAASKAKADEANAQRLSQAVQKLGLKPNATVAEAGKPLRALLQKENYSPAAVKAVMDGFLGKSRLHSLKLEVLDAVRKTNRTLTVDEARMGLVAAQGMGAYLQATNDPALVEANNRKIQSFQDIIDDEDPAKRAQKAEAAKIEELTQAVQKLGLKPDATVAEAGPKLRGFLQSNGYSPAAVKAVMDGFLGKSRLHSLKLEVLDAVRKTNRTLTVDEARMGLVAAQGMEAYLQATNDPALVEANNRKIQSFQDIIDDADPAKRAQEAEAAKIEELTQAVQKLGLKPNATVAEAGPKLRGFLQSNGYSPAAVKAVMDGFLGKSRLFSLKVSLLETAQGIRPLNPSEARMGLEAAQALLKGANTPENKDRVNKFEAAVALSKTKPPPLAKPK